MLKRLVRGARSLKCLLDERRPEGRVDTLRALGMHIGDDVWLPASTWIDESHCFLISIGDHCGFGERCLILAHDAQMNEFLAATRVGRVTIHPSCHIGAGTMIMPGVEIGPRTIVFAGSVVSRSLPADTVCAGAPARVICSLEDYLEEHRQRIVKGRRFGYDMLKDIGALTAEQRAETLQALADGDGYIVSGQWLQEL